jgi:hypothetical protein
MLRDYGWQTFLRNHTPSESYKMEKLNRIQKFAIIIPGIFITAICISTFVERYRVIRELRWVYEYGKDFSLIIFYGAVVWSIVNSILIWRDLKIETPKKILWFLISISVFLYLVVMMTIVMLSNV